MSSFGGIYSLIWRRKKMIKLLRIDDRLLHGQVAFSWTKVLSIESIIIVNDEVVKDEITKMTLGIAKPRGTTLVVKGVEDGIAISNQYIVSFKNRRITLQAEVYGPEDDFASSHCGGGGEGGRNNVDQRINDRNEQHSQNDVDDCVIDFVISAELNFRVSRFGVGHLILLLSLE